MEPHIKSLDNGFEDLHLQNTAQFRLAKEDQAHWRKRVHAKVSKVPIAAWQGSIRYTRSISLLGIPSTKLGKEVDVVVRLIGPDGQRHLLTCGPGVESVDYRSYRIGSYKFSSDENYLYSIGGSNLDSAMDPLLMLPGIIDDNVYITTGESGQGQTNLNKERLFEYDQTGNRRKVAENVGEETTEEVYEIGPGNRITRAEDIRFEYDDNGNMISRINDVNGEIWVYIYDARNCMTEVQKGGGSVRVTVARYVYDPEGNRIKAFYPQKDGTNDGVYYHYDYTGLLTENPIVEEPMNGPKRNFIFLDRKLFARVDGDIGSGAKYWYMTDHLGSAHGLMDQSGEMVWWADYEAFGKAKGVGGPDSGAADEVPRFTGKAWDEKVGLYYFNARWYDPGLSKFIGEDIAKDDLNLYKYCRNNPLQFIDPNGENAGTALSYLKVYDEEIKRIAAQYGIDPDLLRSVIWNENKYRNIYHISGDGFRFMQNDGRGSFGICQVQLATAALLLTNPDPETLKGLTGKEFEDKKREALNALTDAERMELALLLINDPVANMEFAAQYLALIMAITEEDDPEILLSNYNRGLNSWSMPPSEYGAAYGEWENGIGKYWWTIFLPDEAFIYYYPRVTKIDKYKSVEC